MTKIAAMMALAALIQIQSSFHALGVGPVLTINQTPTGEIQITWPFNNNGFGAQQVLSLESPIGWVPVPGGPLVINGQFVHRFTPEGDPAFFRLIERPPYVFNIPAVPGQYELALIDQDYVRTYRLVIPASYTPGMPTPLIFVFHGSGQSAASFTSLHPALLAKANLEGVILVLPDGTVNPVNNKLSWVTNPRVERGIDDIAFIQHLLRELDGALTLDRQRIYATGFSNGGAMTYQLASNTSGMIAAIAPVASSMGYTDETNSTVYMPLPPLQPVAAMIVNGRNDNTRPWDGGTNNNGTLMAAVADSVDYWTDGNSCMVPPTTNVLAGGTVVKTRYPNCSNNTEVILVDLKLADHIWPDANDGVNFDANVEVIDFLLAHQLPAPIPPTNSPVPVVAGTYELRFIDQGMPRLYRLQIPAGYNGATAAPVALVFHGGGQTSASFSSRHPDLFTKCDQEGFILILPEATINPISGTRIWSSNPFSMGANDRLFVRNLLAHLGGDLSLDTNRVYAAGFSNGGSFCHFMAASTTNVLAAIAPVATAVGWNDPVTDAMILPPPAQGPVPALIINGLQDPKRPFHGGPNIDGIDKASAQDSVDYWTAANICLPVSNLVMRASNTVQITTYDQCTGTTEVELAAVGRMDHAWPDAADGWGYDANEEVIEFFKRH